MSIFFSFTAMTIEIGSNKYQFIGKIIVLIVFGCISILPLYALALKGNFGSWTQLIIPCLVTLLFLVGSLVMFVQLRFLPRAVIIDNNSKKLELKYVFQPTIAIGIERIDSYSSTNICTKSDNYKGLLLYLIDGKKILLSDFNLKDYSPIVKFLDDMNVKNHGDEKFLFFAYYTQQYPKNQRSL